MSTTTEVTHTPGPWSFHLGRGANLRFHVQTTGGYQIACTTKLTTPTTAKVARDFEENTVREANARLIAAAPDLLDSLERVLAFAIEANNRCPRPKTAEDMAAGFGCNPYSIKVLKDARAVIAKATGRS